MGKFKVLPTKAPSIAHKTYDFSLRGHYGNSAKIVLLPDGTYNMSVSGWEDNFIIENRAKRDPLYKTGIQRVSNEMLLDYQNQTEFVSLMSKRPFKMADKSGLQKERDKVQMERYQPKDFVVARPIETEVVSLLDIEGKGKFYSTVNNQVEIQKYIRENKESTYNERLAFWNEIQKLYNDIEKANQDNANKVFAKTYNAKRAAYDNIINGDPSVVEKGFQDAQSNLIVPFEISLDYTYDQQKGIISIEVEIPDAIDMFIPMRKASILSTGRISVKDKLQKEIKNEVTQCQLSLLYYIASYAFSLSPNINYCRMSLWTKHKSYGYSWIEFAKSNFKFHTAPSEYFTTWPSINNQIESRGAIVLNTIEKNLFKQLISEKILLTSR